MNVWIPPTRGGKSFVTSSVRGTSIGEGRTPTILPGSPRDATMWAAVRTRADLARSGHPGRAAWGCADQAHLTPSAGATRLCYESVPGWGPGDEGVGAVRIERYPDVDLRHVARPTRCRPTTGRTARRVSASTPTCSSRSPRRRRGPALTYCGACRIREDCLAWALKNGERYGVWGGLTEQQRRRITRQVA